MSYNDQNSRPSIKCPGCGNIVNLPTEHCPRCLFNLRTGIAFSPDAENHPVNNFRLLLLIIGTAILFIIIVSLGFILLSSKEQAQQTELKPPKTSHDVGAALDTLENISQKPVGVRPGAIINATQDIADHVNEKERAEDKAIKELEEK